MQRKRIKIQKKLVSLNCVTCNYMSALKSSYYINSITAFLQVLFENSKPKYSLLFSTSDLFDSPKKLFFIFLPY